jgi:hypothetical protein
MFLIATELKVGYAARLFYGDAFIANQKSTGGVDIFQKFRRLFPNHKGELYKSRSKPVHTNLQSLGVLQELVH